jgi:DNA polymerase-3 subunit alpha
MAQKGFTHLHLHSQYSLLDGAIGLDALLGRCRQLGMESVAVTDHGNLFGAVEFYIKAQEAHIKPIIGIEAYIAPQSRLDRTKCGISDAAWHLILLAENNAGYHNLLKLASIGYTEGFYYRPRIDKQVLAELNEGLICLSGCLKGELTSAVAAGDRSAAEACLDSYLAIFGEKRFFVEVQHHPDSSEPDLCGALAELADKKGVGLVATNDVHFLNADDHEAHGCLCCISTGKTIDDPARMIYPRDVYLKSPGEMRALFVDMERACDNTLAIADRCEVKLDLKSRHSPKFSTPDGSSCEEFLTRLCYEGAQKRYGAVTEQVKSRLDKELQVINSKGLAGYFLIVWDFCNWAAGHQIPCGARGSGVGTVVGYCLGLCDVDPIRYDLLFERFMDPARNEMPDIDIDICQDGRGRVIEYVRQKYGHVAQIITFGTMKARAAIRDVCRVLGVPLAEADRLAKLVPAALGVTLDDAIKSEPELAGAYRTDPRTRRVIDIARKLEGLARHASVHAAGVVIADKPLTNFVPLYKAADSDDLITQFEGPIVEKVGLLKMDFLGLQTLSVLARAVELVEQKHAVKVDLDRLDIADPKVFEVFASGCTKGIFQFESGGMQDLLVRLKPDRIEDLIAANALYRPGPMMLIGDYIDCKHGAGWSVPHPIMEEILRETYGIMVYQEQVMRICNCLGDIPLREAYSLIKAISKKKQRTIAKEKERFLAGCVSKGMSQQEAARIFELIERFAGYGFNKSHSTRYAILAYQTAYMKAYWPLEYMAALLTYEMGSTEKVVEYIGECRRMGIEVTPPDINESYTDFTVVYEAGDGGGRQDVIRFGLAAVKGVGEKAVQQIIEARERIERFRSLFHFCENVDLRAVNKQVMEALIKAGAFDRLGGSRAQMMEGLEKAMQMGAGAQADVLSGQMRFFCSAAGQQQLEQDHQRLPDVPAWSETQMLAYEKQVLGFYVTSNPLSRYAETISVYSTANSSTVAELEQGREVVIGGMVTRIRYNLTKNGRNAGAKMAVFILQDLQGVVEVVLFPEALAANAQLLVEDGIVFVRGRADFRREVPNIVAAELISLDDVSSKLAAKVWIKLDAAQITAEKVAMIKSICSRHKGKSPVYLRVSTSLGTLQAVAGESLRVSPDVEFCKKMEQLVGVENFQLTK